jgi:hypothetical protein
MDWVLKECLHLTESVYELVLQKLILAQFRQLILNHY